MFVKTGDYVPVDTLIQGVVIQSGNDATVVSGNIWLVAKVRL